MPLSVFRSGALHSTHDGNVRIGPQWDALEQNDDIALESEQPSYYSLHMRLQRRQPTLQNLKTVIEKLRIEEPAVVLFLAIVQPALSEGFPACVAFVICGHSSQIYGYAVQAMQQLMVPHSLLGRSRPIRPIQGFSLNSSKM